MSNFGIGDRVVCPHIDDVPGTVVETGYSEELVKVKWDDEVTTLAKVKELKHLPTRSPMEQRNAV